MSCGNPFKHKIQKIIDIWLDMFKFKSNPTDDQMECMQFGICDYAPKKVEDIPYFHFWVFWFNPILVEQLSSEMIQAAET